MAFKIERLKKSQRKLKLALFGPPGSGKTFSSMGIASGLVDEKPDRVLIVDSENKTSELYEDRFPCITAIVNMEKPTIDNMLDVLEQGKAFDVVILDSITHVWYDLLSQVDRLKEQNRHINNFNAWAKLNPKQTKFIETILHYPSHLLATMRSKIEYDVQMENGKIKNVEMIGTAPAQGKDIEYEFDFLLSLSRSHFGTFLKDRTGKFQDEGVDKPGIKFGRELAAWLSEGEPLPAPKESAEQSTIEEIRQIAKALKNLPLSLSETQILDHVRANFNAAKGDKIVADDLLKKIKAMGISFQERIEADAAGKEVAGGELLTDQQSFQEAFSDDLIQ